MPAPHGNFALFALDTIQTMLTWTENRETETFSLATPVYSNTM